MKRIVTIGTLTLLAIGAAGCGQQADLRPLADSSLPPTPYGADAPPQAADLLEQETLAQPERSVELRRRSEEREDDPFDLPPE